MDVVTFILLLCSWLFVKMWLYVVGSRVIGPSWIQNVCGEVIWPVCISGNVLDPTSDTLHTLLYNQHKWSNESCLSEVTQNLE